MKKEIRKNALKWALISFASAMFLLGIINLFGFDRPLVNHEYVFNNVLSSADIAIPVTIPKISVNWILLIFPLMIFTLCCTIGFFKAAKNLMANTISALIIGVLNGVVALFFYDIIASLIFLGYPVISVGSAIWHIFDEDAEEESDLGYLYVPFKSFFWIFSATLVFMMTSLKYGFLEAFISSILLGMGLSAISVILSSTASMTLSFFQFNFFKKDFWLGKEFSSGQKEVANA